MRIQSINNVNQNTTNKNQNPSFGAIMLDKALVPRFEKLMEGLEYPPHFSLDSMAKENSHHSQLAKVIIYSLDDQPQTNGKTLFLKTVEKMELGNLSLGLQMGADILWAAAGSVVKLVDGSRACTEEVLARLEARMAGLKGESPEAKARVLYEFDRRGEI